MTTFRLRILATTDLHMHLCGYDYYADRPDPAVGLTRVATLIRDARAEAASEGRQVLLFDNGDSLQGTPMGEVSASGAANERHPIMRAFGILGYDAIGLGNHDFDFGTGILARILEQSPCPVIGSSLSWPGGPARRSHTIELDGKGKAPLRIGVMSLLPPQTARWNGHVLNGEVQFRDMLDAARETGTALRAKGCDLVLALAHTGLGPEIAAPELENAVIPLAEQGGIDAIVAGHTHLCLPSASGISSRSVDAAAGRVYATPVIMAGSAGSHLGLIDLDLETSPDGYRIARSTAELRPVSGMSRDGGPSVPVAEDPVLLGELTRDHDKTRTRLNEAVGNIDRPLHSYFTFFGHDEASALIAQAQTTAVREKAEDSALCDLPILSVVSPTRFGERAGPRHYTDIPAGPITRRNLLDLLPFRNELRARVLTGAQIAAWLEHSALIFRQIVPGTGDSPLINPDVPGHEFDVIHGLNWQFDLSAPIGNRVRNLTFGGVAVASDRRFLVTMTSYRASGGNMSSPPWEADDISLPTIDIRDTVRDLLKSGGKIETDPHPWKFVPMPDTTVLARTGLGARKHMGDLNKAGVVPLGLDPEGFLQLRLHLCGPIASASTRPYVDRREVGAGERLANPVRSGRKQP